MLTACVLMFFGDDDVSTDDTLGEQTSWPCAPKASARGHSWCMAPFSEPIAHSLRPCRSRLEFLAAPGRAD